MLVCGLANVNPLSVVKQVHLLLTNRPASKLLAVCQF